MEKARKVMRRWNCEGEKRWGAAHIPLGLG